MYGEDASARLALSDYNLYHTEAAASTFFAYVRYTPSAFFTSYTGQPTSGVSKLFSDLGYEQHGRVITGASLFANVPYLVSTIQEGAQCVASTRSQLTLSRGTQGFGFSNGDYIEINGDGVLRRITNLTVASSLATISFTPALPMIPFTSDTMIDDWGATPPSSLARNITLVEAGAQTMS